MGRPPNAQNSDIRSMTSSTSEPVSDGPRAWMRPTPKGRSYRIEPLLCRNGQAKYGKCVNTYKEVFKPAIRTEWPRWAAIKVGRGLDPTERPRRPRSRSAIRPSGSIIGPPWNALMNEHRPLPANTGNRESVAASIDQMKLFGSSRSFPVDQVCSRFGQPGQPQDFDPTIRIFAQQQHLHLRASRPRKDICNLPRNSRCV